MANLSKLQFLVLACLIDGPMHIHAVRHSIIDLTLLSYFPRHSSVATAVKFLLSAGLIDNWMDNPNYWLRARRGEPYCLTKQGLLRARKELEINSHIIETTKLWQIRNKAYGPQRDLFNQS